MSIPFRGESNVTWTGEIQRHLRRAKHAIRTVHPLGCRYPWWTSRPEYNFLPASSQSFPQAWLCSAHDQLPGIHWKWGQNTSIYSGQCCQGILSKYPKRKRLFLLVVQSELNFLSSCSMPLKFCLCVDQDLACFIID